MLSHDTYVHLGRTPATALAPSAPIPLPDKLTEVNVLSNKRWDIEKRIQ